jgi:hypothetical protein
MAYRWTTAALRSSHQRHGPARWCGRSAKRRHGKSATTSMSACRQRTTLPRAGAATRRPSMSSREADVIVTDAG